MGESYAVWSFLLSCVAGGGWREISGAGSLRYSAGWWEGSSPRHAECINLWALCFGRWGALKCLAIVFLSRITSIWEEVGARPTQRQLFTWALLRRRAATDRLQGSPNLASLVL